MFLVFIAFLLLASVPAFGGDLRRIFHLQLAGRWLIVSAVVLQIGINQVARAWPHALLAALHLASYALIGWALWLNRRIPGLAVIALGAAVNAAVIGLNGGTLPASARALREAGITPDANFTNSGVLPHPILKQLGDIVATPSWLPFRNVISIGDLVILLGLAVLVHTVCTSRLVPRHRREVRETLDAKPLDPGVRDVARTPGEAV